MEVILSIKVSQTKNKIHFNLANSYLILSFLTIILNTHVDRHRAKKITFNTASTLS
jgi:hypothetical protein